ncbi:hypothetical protein [Herbiconiux liangxiaofengii]
MSGSFVSIPWGGGYTIPTGYYNMKVANNGAGCGYSDVSWTATLRL